MDDQAKGRNDRIKLIKDVIEIYKRKKWGWLWVEAGQQSALEKQLNVNDFPNVMVVNPRKHVSVKMLSGFHKSGLEEFFRNIAYGKTGTAVSTFDDFAEIAEVQEWDGKDGKLEVDEVNLKFSTRNLFETKDCFWVIIFHIGIHKKILEMGMFPGLIRGLI